MALLRRHLTAVGITWLLFQATSLAVSPFITCCTVVSTQAAVDDDDCCKGMAPGQMCPLHRHRQAPKDDAQRDQAPSDCAMRSGCGQQTPALIALGFGLGIVPDAISLDVIPVSISASVQHRAVLSRSSSFDPPPPRA
jgi:hypothetical protein